MSKLLLILLFLVSSDVFSSPTILKNKSLVRNCDILNIKGELSQTFPGNICLFFDDGSIVATSFGALKFFDKLKNMKWELKGHFHHQLNMSSDGEKILALSSDFKTRKGKNVRVDKFMVISREGKILHQQTSDVLLNQLKLPALNLPNPPMLKKIFKSATEISHFNSFYEILSQKIKSPLSALKEGNFIINGLEHGIFILTPDLKQILHHVILPTAIKHAVHDVQVSTRGNFLLFNNVSSAGSLEQPFSAIQEITPIGHKIIMEFTATPKAMFYSQIAGSVQELDDDHLLFADNLNGTFIYSISQNSIILTIRNTHYRDMIHHKNQQTKALNLTKFLQSRKNH